MAINSSASTVVATRPTPARRWRWLKRILGRTLYFGGSPDTVHMRNVRATGRAVAYVGDGLAAAVFVEGNVTDETPTPDVAARLAVGNNTKYADYGMTMQPRTT